MKPSKIKIFLVDDDTVYLKLLEIEFLNLDEYIIESFVTGELCLQHLSHKPDIVVLDYHLNGVDKHAMNGIETLDRIKEYDPNIPVIILSSQDKVDVAVNCLHHKAFDYIIKSETAFLRLQEIIKTYFRFKKIETNLNWYMNRV